MVNSRNKGASFERIVARALFDELGIEFKRDLRQYQQAEYGDLVTDDPAWPYLLELKRYATGPIGGQEAWWKQAETAAIRANLRPVLIYKYDRQPIRCVLMLMDVKADISFEDFCYIARERMG
jgi:hypothetical protein